MPNVDFLMSNNGWNGDFQIDATGDIILVQDQPSYPLATQQRLYRLLMMNPRLFDGAGNPISCGDDLFATDYGAGIRALTGQMITPAFIELLTQQIIDGLASDPDVVLSPLPTINVQNVGNNTVLIDVSCTIATGETVTLPTFTLPGG